MPTIEALNVKPLTNDYYATVGQTAKIIITGPSLDLEMVQIIPRITHLVPLTHEGDKHLYDLRVFGYTVKQFVEIVRALFDERFEAADELIEQLPPSGSHVDYHAVD